MVSAKITVPRVSLELENLEAVISAMTEQLAARVSERTAKGAGADGPLPAPKDGGEPLKRTGTLLSSIGAKVRPGTFGPARKGRSSAPVGIVRAFGPRPAEERASLAKKRAAARAKTLELRARAKRAVAQASRARVGLSLYMTAQDRRDLGAVRLMSNTLRVGRIRRRTVVDNASLAAILSVPPKDARGLAGGRRVYRVFEATASEVAEARDTCERLLRPKLVETGRETVKR